jgi:hypothetical protein
MNDLTSRKFILTIIGMLLCSVAFFVSKISSLEFLSTITTLITGYGILNVLDKGKPNG